VYKHLQRPVRVRAQERVGEGGQIENTFTLTDLEQNNDVSTVTCARTLHWQGNNHGKHVVAHGLYLEHARSKSKQVAFAFALRVSISSDVRLHF